MEFYQPVNLCTYTERPAGLWLLDYLALVLEEMHSESGTHGLGDPGAGGVASFEVDGQDRSRGVA